MLKASISEAATRLNVSVDTVRRRLREGALSGERDSRGHWRIDLSDTVGSQEQPPKIGQDFTVGVAMPLQQSNSDDQLINTLYAQIDDLRRRLDRSEAERSQERENASLEREKMLSLIERLASRDESR